MTADTSATQRSEFLSDFYQDVRRHFWQIIFQINHLINHKASRKRRRREQEKGGAIDEVLLFEVRHIIIADVTSL
jgi:hypothetical protein